MLNTSESVLAAFHSIYRAEIPIIVKYRITRATTFLDGMEKAVSTFMEYIDLHKSAQYNSLLTHYLQLINDLESYNDQFYIHPQVETYNELYEKFKEAKENLCLNIQPIVTEEQDEKSFLVLRNDSAWVQIGKKYKRSLVKIQQAVSSKNKQITWKRKVPLRYYSFYYFIIAGIPDVWDLFKVVLAQEKKGLLELKKALEHVNNQFSETSITTNRIQLQYALIDFKVRIKQTKQLLDAIEKRMNGEIDNAFHKTEKAFISNYYKAGTFELQSRKLNNRKLKRLQANQRKRIRHEFLSWETNMFATSEDWSFDMDLYKVKIATLQASSELQKRLVSKKEKATIKKLKEVRKHVVSVKDLLNKTRGRAEGYQENLQKHRKDLNEMLDDDDLKLTVTETDKESLPEAMEALKEKIAASIDSISNERMLYSNVLKKGKAELNDLVAVRPREMLYFEIYPGFKTELTVLSKQAEQQLKAYDVQMVELKHFVDYIFDTAEFIVEIENTSVKDSKEISDEGLELALEKIESTIDQVQTIYSDLHQEFNKILNRFISRIIDLTDNAKVSELRLRLLRAKAESIWTTYKGKALQFLSVAWEWIQTQSKQLLSWGAGVSGQLADMYYLRDKAVQVNTDISNFLSETRTAIDKLPFLYKRLFKLEPTHTGYLFYPRKKELLALREAYHNWRLGRFAPAVAVAEKGAGITSLIKNLLMDISYEKRIIQFSQFNGVYKENIMLSTLAEVLGLEKVQSKEDVIEQLNSREEKLVVVAEGIQNVFLRKVDGFSCLPVLFEIISRTNKNVFWLSSCTKHSWDFLQKTIRISNYFGYVVYFGEFSNDEMVNIVTTRHKVSGYELQFIPSKQDLENKHFTRMKGDEKQDFLKKQFFRQLNTLAQGNLSVAFIFWLRSTNALKDNVLTISSMANFDSSFIKNLEMDRLFSLHALLLHDGLDIEGFCKVMRYPMNTGKDILMQMVDDGLLMKFGERYTLNFLLYRSAITALKAQNILH